MFRQTLLPLAVLAAVAFSTGAAMAQDYSSDSPPVGREAAYDYNSHEYFDHYEAPPAEERRALEQDGYRNGHAPIAPRTGYYAGVELLGGYGYGYGYGWDRGGCGCAHYDRRYTQYYDDFGNRGASYSGYNDRRREDSRRYDRR